MFFFGAGFSVPAGLPSFKELVCKLYEKPSRNRSLYEKTAFHNENYETVIELLEDRLHEGRTVIRRELTNLLQPSPVNANSTALHRALLSLARQRDGKLRLVTTNIDRVFEEVTASQTCPVNNHRPPSLPIPDKEWDDWSICMGCCLRFQMQNATSRLHGISWSYPVVTSDGPNLKERWAACFVSELFQNYSVCFIGYSIADPVMRYMLDASADSQSRSEMFALGGYDEGEKDKEENEWKAKKVTPVLYKSVEDHRYLRDTLQEWASTYSGGAAGKKGIVTQHANSQTVPMNPDRYAVPLVRWALTDRAAVQLFANMNPVPPLDWLAVLDRKQSGHDELPSRDWWTARTGNGTQDRRCGLDGLRVTLTTPDWYCGSIDMVEGCIPNSPKRLKTGSRNFAAWNNKTIKKNWTKSDRMLREPCLRNLC